MNFKCAAYYKTKSIFIYIQYYNNVEKYNAVFFLILIFRLGCLGICDISVTKLSSRLIFKNNVCWCNLYSKPFIYSSYCLALNI